MSTVTPRDLRVLARVLEGENRKRPGWGSEKRWTALDTAYEIKTGRRLAGMGLMKRRSGERYLLTAAGRSELAKARQDVPA